MKIIGKRPLFLPKGEVAFEKTAWLLKMAVEFRKENAKYIPNGVYHFRTFEEAERWRHQMLLGKKPDLPS